MGAKQSIYHYGARVLVGPEGGKVEATVLGVEMRGHGYSTVSYLVSWWDDKTCRSEWLQSVQVESADEGEPRAAVVHSAEGL
jgi:hypothetical protein